MYCRTWERILLRKDLVKTVLSAMLRKLIFQPTSLLFILSNYQLEVTIDGPRMDHGKPKVFPKSGAGIHSKHSGQLISSITKEIEGKEGLGLVVVVSLARLST